MQTVVLGKTGLVVSKNGFGALPIQRISTYGLNTPKLLARNYEDFKTFI